VSESGLAKQPGDSGIVQAEIPDAEGIEEAGLAQLYAERFDIPHEGLPIGVGAGSAIALGNNPAGRDGGRGSVDREFVGLPADGELGDVDADVVGVDALGEIAGAEGGLDVEGDGAVGDF